MSQVALSARNLTKIIGDRVIVDDVSFDVNAGEILGFLGPNGAGKTTTIRMLVGLIRPTRGTVQICQFDLRRQFEEAMRCVGCIVETPDLYRFMTGRENLEHFARMLGGAGADIEQVSALVNMSHRLDQKVGTYSLGMRQRLGIAQALLGRPRLLILDEPANGLDPAGIREIRELLRKLAGQGLAVFVSSHLLAEIELMCDRVAIIHKGRLLRTGSVPDLIAGQRTMEFQVGAVEAARALAEELGFVVSAHGERIVVQMDEASVPKLIAAMSGRGISVFQARERTRTLEELFIDITGGETVS